MNVIFRSLFRQPSWTRRVLRRAAEETTQSLGVARDVAAAELRGYMRGLQQGERLATERFEHERHGLAERFYASGFNEGVAFAVHGNNAWKTAPRRSA